ncbi:hypothetical protein VP01_3244g1 [Puccinia sorghi]|uniref:Major facilitator superfamily (MFS) profile domain-containing protein n=1 Tax=Puccinia sorghi TaxID=27349 RepID=A0A0L6UZY9_9BASI|nr:hypothetical protein VP01_3244g1 [Puccinia sorghi]
MLTVGYCWVSKWKPDSTVETFSCECPTSHKKACRRLGSTFCQKVLPGVLISTLTKSDGTIPGRPAALNGPPVICPSVADIFSVGYGRGIHSCEQQGPSLLPAHTAHLLSSVGTLPTMREYAVMRKCTVARQCSFYDRNLLATYVLVDSSGFNPCTCASFRTREESTAEVGPCVNLFFLFFLERRLIPILGLYFFLSFLDRSNLGNVRIIGEQQACSRLQKDLRMSDHDYSMALTVTFMLIDLKDAQLVELPSNLLMYKIGPSIYIPLLVTIWGLVTCLQGLVTKAPLKLKQFGGTATRDFLYPGKFFLGLVEGKLLSINGGCELNNNYVMRLKVDFIQPPCSIYQLSTKVATTVARPSVFLTRNLSQVRAATSNRVVLGYDLSGWRSIGITDLCDHQPGWALGTSWLGLGFSGMFPCHLTHHNIEGFATSMFGLMGFFFLPSSIEKVGFLTDAEKSMLLSRLKLSSFAPSETTLKSFEKSSTFQTWEAVKSPHILILDVAQFAAASNIYSIAYFTPTGRQKFPLGQSCTVVAPSLYLLSPELKVALNFRSGQHADLVTNSLVTHLQPLSCSQVCEFPLIIGTPVPPFAVGFVFVVLISYLSDRYHARGAMSSICALLSILGFAIFYASGHETVRYGSLFLSIPGAYGVSPNMTAWLADNSAPSKRKATALAFGTMVGNMGGLFSVWIFTLGRKPRYHLPTAINIAFGGVIIVCCFLNTMWLRHAQANKVTKRHQILEKYGIYEDNADPLPAKDGSQSPLSRQRTLSVQAWDELGDKHPDFKYVY